MDTQKLAEILQSLQGDNTAAWLANEIGISAQMTRLYLKGTGGIPGADKLQKIAAYMGVTMDELAVMLGGESAPKACESTAVYNVFTAKDAYQSCVFGLPKKEKLKLAKLIMNEAV